MNILITGGLGHIGTHLLNSINKIKKLNKVYIIDNNSNNRINSIFNYKLRNLNLIIDDLSDDKCFKKIKHKISIVIHLASITDAASSVKNKKKVYDNNFGCFVNIVNFCKKNKCKLIHISSTSVYGSNEKLVDEDCKELRPQSPYAEVKLLEENYIKKSKKINFITLRFGTIVGYSLGMRFHTAVNKFCYHTIMDKPITVWKTAIDQYRPYLSLNDAFKTLKYIIEKNYFDNRVHNVCTNNYTVRQIISLIKKNKKKISINFTKSKIMNQLSYKVINKTNLLSKIKLRKKIDKDIKDIFLSFKKIR